MQEKSIERSMKNSEKNIDTYTRSAVDSQRKPHIVFYSDDRDGVLQILALGV